MDKFKIGENVVCINGESGDIHDKGAGWECGKKFKIGSISQYEPEDYNILWPQDNMRGVYAKYVKIDDGWNSKLN